MLWEDEFWQTNANRWTDNGQTATQNLGKLLEIFQTLEERGRNPLLQREACSPSIVYQTAFKTLSSPVRDSRPEERRNPSLRPLQQWGVWHSQQAEGKTPLSSPQLIEALQQLEVVQEPGDQQLVGEQPQQGDWPQPLNMQPLGINQQTGWGQQQQPQWGPQQPIIAPPFRATFDGDPEKLIFFLNQVRSHLNRWAYLYLDPEAMVDVIASSLEGEASEWLNNLYNEQAPELEDPHLFLLGLKERFEDPSLGLKAREQILKIKQAGRPALEYVREFRKIAG